jgi:hypothetical protein
VSKLTDRVRLILTSPQTEWPVIAGESTTIADLYTGYILILAAIPPVCSFLSSVLMGWRIGAVNGMATGYVLSLIAVFVVGLVIEALAPTFGGQKDRIQAMKTAAYAHTASWVAGVGLLLPGIGWLIALAGALYSIYLLYLGLPHTMRNSPDKSAGYTAVIVVVAIVLSWIIGLITGGMMTAGMGGMHRTVI